MLAANSQVPGMPKRILIIQAHPDQRRPHLAHSLAAAYANGAEGAGHTVRRVVQATLDFPLLRSQQEWEEGSVLIGLTVDLARGAVPGSNGPRWTA
jgi:putative NADPH-quinone reductase